VEQVYAVPARLLPGPRPGLIEFSRPLYSLLRTAGRFGARADLEADEGWRQVVPYAVVRHSGRVLLMRRTRAGADARLHDRYSVGVGGHINPPDAGADPIQAALLREVGEEVAVTPSSLRPLGFLHRDGNAVERVHTGVLYLLESSTPPAVLETDKLEGRLARLDEVADLRDRLEGWSQVALDWLEREAGAGREW